MLTRPHARIAAVAASLFLFAGCGMSLHAETGYVSGIDHPDTSDGWGLNFYAGLGDDPVAGSLGVRSKRTGTADQVALSLDLAAFGTTDLLSPYGRLGVHLLQWEDHDEYGENLAAGSPYLEGGLMFNLNTQTATDVDAPSVGVFATLAATIEYTVRLDDLPDSWYWGVMAGLGIGFELM